MYSDNQTVQILISLLKQFNVRHAVLSPGTRNVPVVHSLEQDVDFKCYSVVDERSAAYFGLGLALETGEPVLLSCTSGTAATNYTSALWEASRQHLPLIALTSDRNPCLLEQQEDQMIDQAHMYRSAVRKSVTLPIVKDAKDAWYCRRLVNEALLALHHRDGGPVQINLPTDWGLFAQNFNTAQLPHAAPIRRFDRRSLLQENIPPLASLDSKHRILIMIGQGREFDHEYRRSLETFADRYSCVVTTETISNLRTEKAINTSLICRALTKEMFLAYAPDLVISAGGNYVSPIKGLLQGCAADFEHWCINEDGAVIDQFRRLSAVFECTAQEFFDYFNTHSKKENLDTSYRDLWRDQIAALPEPNFPYSSSYVMQEFIKQVPDNAILHHGNGVAIHIAQYFPTSPNIKSYCHTGTTTIDGSLSTFVGQAAATDRLCFAFIGDLSFFYDMNAIWNRHVRSNVRILLYNNEGGQTFHWNSARQIDTLPQHISAEHFTSAQGWVESRGFRYLCARTKDEFDTLLPELFAADSDQPICFEVFTKKDFDGQVLHDYYDQCRKHLLSLTINAEDE